MRDLLRGMDARAACYTLSIFLGLYRRFGVVICVVFFGLVFGAFVLGVIPRISVSFSLDLFEGNMDGCVVHLCD
jgi:hypothetical protein